MDCHIAGICLVHMSCKERTARNCRKSAGRAMSVVSPSGTNFGSRIISFLRWISGGIDYRNYSFSSEDMSSIACGEKNIIGDLLHVGTNLHAARCG